MKLPEILHIQLPKDFIISKSGHTSFRAENQNITHEVQMPYFDFTLRKISDIQVDNNLDFMVHFTHWSRGFKSEVITKEEIVFKGCKTYIIHAKTDAVFGKQAYKLTYFSACVLLDETYCLDFQFTYETHLKPTYQNLVQEVFQSIEKKGSPEEWSNALLKDIQELEAKINFNTSQMDINEETNRMENLEIQYPLGENKMNLSNLPIEVKEAEWKTYQNDLRINFTLKTSNFEKLIQQELVSDWTTKESVLEINIRVKGIYKNGIPKGEFILEEGRNNERRAYVSFKNVQIGLDFSGKLFLFNNWVVLEGWLERSYDKENGFPISLYHQLDAKTIDWSNYEFSTSEFEQAPPEVIGILNYQDPKLSEFPDKIFACSNLKTLTIQGGKTKWVTNKYVSTYAPMNQIPKEIGQLKSLESISLFNLSLTELPEEIGNFKNLIRLHIHSCTLEKIPASVFQLPKLKWLSIIRTSLKSIPENINLKALQSLSLKENMLSNLPESVALQPQLTTLKLEKNKWESLPQNILNIEDLALEQDIRNALLDNSYPGADGSGTIEWEDDLFLVQKDEEFSDVKKKIAQYKLESFTPFINRVLKKGVEINLGEKDNYTQIGNSRIGGQPDLPIHIPYPTFGIKNEDPKEEYVYEFIGQINCAEISSVQDYLPREGMLYFFLSTIHDVYESEDSGKVIYYNGNEALVSGKEIQFKESDYFEVSSSPPYTPQKISTSAIQTLPHLYAANQNKHWFKDEDEMKNVREAYDSNDDLPSLTEDLDPEFDLGMNTYMFTQHESPELQAAIKHRGNPEDWIILLQVTSCGDFQWGDAGDLAFVIHKSDLAKKDFSKIFVTMESS